MRCVHAIRHTRYNALSRRQAKPAASLSASSLSLAPSPPPVLSPKFRLASPQRAQPRGEVSGHVRKRSVRRPQAVPDQAAVVGVALDEHYRAFVSEFLFCVQQERPHRQGQNTDTRTKRRRFRFKQNLSLGHACVPPSLSRAGRSPSFTHFPATL